MINENEFILKLKFTLDIDIDMHLSPSTQLQDLKNWDSISVMNLLLLLDVEYDIKVSPQTIYNCKTVNDLFQIANP